jgi:hypothetical protein
MPCVPLEGGILRFAPLTSNIHNEHTALAEGFWVH